MCVCYHYRSVGKKLFFVQAWWLSNWTTRSFMFFDWVGYRVQWKSDFFCVTADILPFQMFQWMLGIDFVCFHFLSWLGFAQQAGNGYGVATVGLYNRVFKCFRIYSYLHYVWWSEHTYNISRSIFKNDDGLRLENLPEIYRCLIKNGQHFN